MADTELHSVCVVAYLLPEENVVPLLITCILKNCVRMCTLRLSKLIVSEKVTGPFLVALTAHHTPNLT
jgi:hypothetical protein